MIYINDRLETFDVEASLPLLSAQRREQVMRFRHELGRRTCAASYLLLREGLKLEYDIEEEPVFGYGAHGKPFLINHPEIHFNLSHCREAVICAVSDKPVGADVESVSHYNEDVARYTMNDMEMQEILQAERPDVAFTRLWTMKEALLKLSGEGLRTNMKDVLDGKSEFLTVISPDMRYVYSVVYGLKDNG